MNRKNGATQGSTLSRHDGYKGRDADGTRKGARAVRHLCRHDGTPGRNADGTVIATSHCISHSPSACRGGRLIR